MASGIMTSGMRLELGDTAAQTLGRVKRSGTSPGILRGFMECPELVMPRSIAAVKISYQANGREVWMVSKRMRGPRIRVG